MENLSQFSISIAAIAYNAIKIYPMPKRTEMKIQMRLFCWAIYKLNMEQILILFKFDWAAEMQRVTYAWRHLNFLSYL